MSINEVRLLGNLGRDPEIRTTPSGAQVATLNLATTRKWKDRDGNPRDRTTWHRITIWGEGLIDKVVRPYAKKGSKVFIGGELQNREWEDQNGQKRYATDVVVNGPGSVFELCSGNRRDDPPPPDSPDDYGRRGGGQAAKQTPPASDDLDDDIPF